MAGGTAVCAPPSRRGADPRRAPVYRRSPWRDEKNARYTAFVPAGGEWLERPIEGCGGFHRQTPALPATGAGLLSAVSRGGIAVGIRGVQRRMGCPGR